MLPEPVLLEAQRELLNWQGSGMSVMEVGHRSAPFLALMEQLEADLRELIAIPDHYHVLFLGSPARTQFSMVPMNLLDSSHKAGYLTSGLWSTMALEEASKLRQAYCIASSEHGGFLDVPDPFDGTIEDDTAYVYYVPNETVNGVRFNNTPKIGDIPLVADMTSCLLSEPVNVSDFGLIFAGAQKNISIAGLTIVIIRNDLLTQSVEASLPTMMDYRTHVRHHSLYATPPTFNCYIASKMLTWIKQQGGVDALYDINCKKAAALYQYIDASDFYCSPVKKNARSMVNVCFSIEKKELELDFIARANLQGLFALQGHRTVGGLRASLYNAMPMQAVEALIAFMQAFCKEYR